MSELNVMIVEDNHDLGRVLSLVVRKRGHELVYLDSAESAWIELQNKFYHLVILDWHLLGEMTGIDLTKKIRSSEWGESVIILMITGAKETKFQEEAIKSGVDDYLVKPFGMSLLDIRLSIAEKMCAFRLEHKDSEDKNEKALIRSDQMAAVGILASGVAHEFNNINSVIRGHLESILIKNDLREHVKDQLEIVLKMVRRSVDITRSLLVFTKASQTEKYIVSLTEVANDVVNFIQPEFEAEGMSVKWVSSENVKAYLNEASITQVFMNLIINAKHSMIDSEIKEITVDVGVVGNEAYFSVSDTGCGIPYEDLNYLFDPFFSTKGERAHPGSPLMKVRGTGLGLSICHTIITKHHGGRIDVESEINRGSKFTVWLKAADNELLKNTTGEFDISLFKGKGERVLVLDDEDDIVFYITRVLKDSGYVAFGFSDCKEALEHHKKVPFDAVVVDHQMPGMTGIEFIKELNKCKNIPGKVMITGNPFNRNDFNDLGLVDILPKPFSFKSLLVCIRAAIDK